MEPENSPNAYYRPRNYPKHGAFRHGVPVPSWVFICGLGSLSWAAPETVTLERGIDLHVTKHPPRVNIHRVEDRHPGQNALILSPVSAILPDGRKLKSA